MAISDTKLKKIQAKEKSYQMADGGGLYIEVLPSGRKVWRLRYRLNGIQEKATLGEYLSFSLLEARKWREECKSLIAHGASPAQKKQKEKLKQKESTTVEAFSQRWLTDIVEKSNQHPRNII